MSEDLGVAFELLWQAYPSLVRRMTLIVRDPQEGQDLAQAAVLRALEAWKPGEIRDPRAWLYTIGTRLALNEVRRRRWFFRSPMEQDLSAAITVDPDLWAALGRIGRMERAVLVMQVLDGYTHGEIADRLGVPIGTVSSWLSRGKAELRELLTDGSLDSVEGVI